MSSPKRSSPDSPSSTSKRMKISPTNSRYSKYSVKLQIQYY